MATSDICNAIEKLEKSINALDEAGFGMITGKYIENVSTRKLGRRYGYSQSGIMYRLKKQIEALAKIMSD